MNRSISETPGNWVVIKILQTGSASLYKVFGGWRGGYLDGDRWKMNSGIVKVEEDEDNFYFFGYSGSCYQCSKRHYGIIDNVTNFGSYASGVLDNIITKAKESEYVIEVMSDDTDWMNLLKQTEDEEEL